MRAASAFYYETRLVAGLSGLLPCLGLPAYAALSRLLWGGYDELSLGALSKAFVILLPLAAGLSSAHLMGIETEEGFDELRRSYPEPRLWLPLVRGVSALAFLLMASALGAVAFWLAWGLFDPILVLEPAFPPALFLCGLSLLTGGLSRSYWAAVGLTMGWWFLELQIRGQITGALFLFQAVWPCPGVSLQLNHALLTGVGIAFLGINAFVYAYRAGWKLRRHTLGAG
jgi:hypothetical protein